MVFYCVIHTDVYQTLSYKHFINLSILYHKGGWYPGTILYLCDCSKLFHPYKHEFSYVTNKHITWMQWNIFIIMTLNYVVCSMSKMYKPSLYSTTTRILRLCKPVRMRDWAGEPERDWDILSWSKSVISVLLWLPKSQYHSVSLRFTHIMTAQAHRILVVALYLQLP